MRESIDNVIKIATRIVYYGEADVVEGSGANEANDFNPIESIKNFVI